VQERQRQIQIRRNAEYVGKVEEVLVDGFNRATQQWTGKTSQHKQLNFTHPLVAEPGEGVHHLEGTYLPVRVLRAGPNSLAGEAVLVS
jgi:tRNA-2-methylthio-N6-dimethylallyladenosine synthase